MKAAYRKSFTPRADRRSISMRGFALSSTRDCDVQLCDLSYEGCGMRCEDKLTAGEVIELRIFKRGAIDAEIRWTAQGRAGAQFLG